MSISGARRNAPLRRAALRATKPIVTTGQGNTALPAADEDFASAWRELRADGDIQYSEVEVPEVQAQPPPDWVTDLMQALAGLFAPIARFVMFIWPVLQWVLLAVAVALVAYFVVRVIGPSLGWSKRGSRKSAREEREEWVPEQQEALALLEEADRLAAAGDYDEATHLLLKRSVGQIAAARPDLVEPSSTARELAAEPRLPDAARNAFGLIAAPVERSLFALSRLSQDDWLGARAAYADFALAQKAIGQRVAA